MISTQILESLQRDCYYNPAKPLVVGVSGGADSLTLLHCLHRAGLNVIVGHMDHGLRATSAQEAETVSNLMNNWEVPCVVGQADVSLIARMLHLGTEEAARICRYQFLFKLASQYNAQAVAVAHHADDQVETVLMHFLRGSGINGLKGMRPVSFLKEINPCIPLFRPMLGVYREDILAYCQEYALPYITDESNLDSSYFRNRLRMELIPELQKYSPAFKQVTLRNARALQSDLQILENLEKEAFQCCLVEKETSRIIFDLPVFLELEEGLQKRVLLMAVNQLKPGLRNIELEQVERVIHSIRARQQRTNFLSEIEVWLERETIQLLMGGRKPDFPDLPQLSGDQQACPLAPGQPVRLASGWLLNAEIVDRQVYLSASKADQQDCWQAWLNPADMELPLMVRPTRSGERWVPFGMEGKHQKLSDFFINNKIPQIARAKWPLVVSEGSILWVGGLRIGQAWRLCGDENEILHLRLIRPTVSGG
ncbi:MAG: tRNA lysidine(34) synthetase TilS [Anaerolineaceae bacterium]|jgi:tRNA(Ile)-lysidine synthase